MTDDPSKLLTSADRRRRMELVRRFKERQESMIRDALSSIKKGILHGKDLVALRPLIRHGEWESWVRKNLGVGRSQAHKYVTLATHEPEVRQILNVHPDGHLSIDRVIKLLQPPKPPKPTPPTPAPELAPQQPPGPRPLEELDAELRLIDQQMRKLGQRREKVIAEMAQLKAQGNGFFAGQLQSA